jgi:alpha-galactosidase
MPYVSEPKILIILLIPKQKRNMKKIYLLLSLLMLFLPGCKNEIKKSWLSDGNLSLIEVGWGTPGKNVSVGNNKLTVNGKSYDNGVGLHSECRMMLSLDGKVQRFHALVGVDDEAGENGSVEFVIMADKKILWRSGEMTNSDSVRVADVNLRGRKIFALVVTKGENKNNYYDHADVINACFEYKGKAPELIPLSKEEKYILTPTAPAAPHINGATVTGASAGKPFIFRIPAAGERPMRFLAKGLPEGLKLDGNTGVISGVIAKNGEYRVELNAENNVGKDSRELRIVIGKGLALTPIMGWNSWNCWGLEVNETRVKAAADAFESTGLADHGWTYINIDDGWEAPQRASNGEIVTNNKFPDMKSLTDYVHSKGFKMGIYSSPGPKTCGGYLGSYRHEKQDAMSYAKWGIDYLKYDWCSYGDINTDTTLDGFQKPYIVMGTALQQCSRDIVYSLCQYGMADVWKWGAKLNGNLWRTTGDINDSWSSMSDIGFSQAPLSPYAGPGHWNDPDMLVVGKVGWSSDLHESKLTPDEQYTHISLWAMLSAPLLIGCNLTELDEFTLNLLTNDEVIAVNQDSLGIQASKVLDNGDLQVWSKPLADGALAIGIFNLSGSEENPVEMISWESTPICSLYTLKLKDIGLDGTYNMRDLWRQQDEGTVSNEISGKINKHGVKLIKLTPVR